MGLGEVLCRFSPPQGERLEQARDLSVHVGGAEANVVAALARFGIASSIVSCLPNSPLGRRARGELALAGVDLRHLTMGAAKERIGTFFAERSSGVWPTEVWYDRAESYFARAIEWPQGSLNGARFAVMSGITPAISEHARLACEAMLREAHETGAKVCLDVNYRARMWSIDAAREALEPFLAAASLVVCSERDATLLFGPEANDPRWLLDRYAPAAEYCVVTQGERGALGFQANVGPCRVEARPTRGGDRIGIGDAFTAGVICGLVENQSMSEALSLGSRSAALKAGTVGDMSLARRRDLDVVADTSSGSTVLR